MDSVRKKSPWRRNNKLTVWILRGGCELALDLLCDFHLEDIALVDACSAKGRRTGARSRYESVYDLKLKVVPVILEASQ